MSTIAEKVSFLLTLVSCFHCTGRHRSPSRRIHFESPNTDLQIIKIHTVNFLKRQLIKLRPKQNEMIDGKRRG